MEGIQAYVMERLAPLMHGEQRKVGAQKKRLDAIRDVVASRREGQAWGDESAELARLIAQEEDYGTALDTNLEQTLAGVERHLTKLMAPQARSGQHAERRDYSSSSSRPLSRSEFGPGYVPAGKESVLNGTIDKLRSQVAELREELDGCR